MPLAVYMDAHVPASISAGLRRRGIDVLTSQEDGTDQLPDAQLLQRAHAIERILFSQDDDLLSLAAEWQRQSKEFHGVIYAHQLSAGVGTLVQDMELVLRCCSKVELASSVMYLPLK